MPPIEELLRGEFRRVTETVQAGQLRPLRMPASGRRWRPRLLPAAAGAAVIAIATVAAVLAGGPASQRPTTSPPPAAMPRYYVTAVHTAAGLEAVVRDSDSGSVTGTVALPESSDAYGHSVTAAADERTFVIAAASGRSHIAGTAPMTFFRLSISADGRPGQPVRLNVPTGDAPVAGMALSPDGTMLALSLVHEPLALGAAPYGSTEIINLATGATRTWSGRGDPGYWPGALWWGNAARTLTLTWWRNSLPSSGGGTIVGVRQLDIAAPGSNLLESPLISFPAAISGIWSAVITSGGRAIIASSCHPVATARGHLTAAARVAEFSAADGRLLRVLHTQVVRFPNTAAEVDAVTATCSVLSADPSGEHVLVQAFQFGRIDNGVFTALPGTSPPVLFVAAGW